MIGETINSILRGLVKLLHPVKWHNLRYTKPISSVFGFERGTPIDRYYIDQFLNSHKHYIKGTVLEIADSYYSSKYGDAVGKFEILHKDATAIGVTLTGDLENPDTLPENAMDCFICTQTLNFIFKIDEAMESSYKLLKPGGSLLLTVAGLCQISAYDYDRWGDYWRFTDQSIRRLATKYFKESNVRIQAHGNVLAATALIHGIAAEELTFHELSETDRSYQVIITLHAIK